MHNITEITSYDNKRNKVTLDYGEVTFLLYKGECGRLGIADGSKNDQPLSDEQYDGIMSDILLPRAKKRVLYYLKSADKTRDQIRRKLRESLYPETIISETFDFLDRYGFADDRRYAKQYAEELRGTKSSREIAQKLSQRGISRQDIEEQLISLTQEDEYAACDKALQRKYPKGITADERRKAYAYLARRGFAYDAIEHAVNNTLINTADWSDNEY